MQTRSPSTQAWGHLDPRAPPYLLSSSSVSPESSAPLPCSSASGSLVNARHMLGNPPSQSFTQAQMQACQPPTSAALQIQLSGTLRLPSPRSTVWDPAPPPLDAAVWVSSLLLPQTQESRPRPSGSDLNAPRQCRYLPGALVRLVWSLLAFWVSEVSWVLLPEGAWFWSGGAEEPGSSMGVSVCSYRRQEWRVWGPRRTHVLLPLHPPPHQGRGHRTFWGSLGASSPLPPL